MNISSRMMLAMGLLGAASVAVAAPLTPEAALKRANQSGSFSAPSTAKIELKKSVLAENLQPAVYVFGYEDNRPGFMIVSGDDCAPAVLGYSETAAFDPQDIPDGLQYMLDCYAQEIAHAGNVRYLAPTRAERADIAPMVTTQWNQNAPYYNDCPKNGITHTVTGCAATSTAQVMNYHQYPDVGTGSNSVRYNNKTYKVDFAEHPFDWANMLDTYPKTATAEEKAAVANLMYCVGVSINMNYGTGSSGATDSDIPHALVNYFKYDKGVYIATRSYYRLADWEELIYNELSNKRPVIYNGVSLEGGHSFVCDGYQGDGYFHINWGWGGVSDGYFLLNALDPDVQGIGGSSSGFNAQQTAIVGIQKPLADSDYHYMMCLEGFFTITPTSANTGTNITVSAGEGAYNGYFNLSSVTLYDILLGLEYAPVDGGTPMYMESVKYSSVDPSYGTASYTVRLPNRLANGTFTVRPVYKHSKSDWQPILISLASAQTATMVVNNGKVTFTVKDPVDELEVGIKSVSPLYVNTAAKVGIEIKNPSESEFYGGLMVGLAKGNSTSLTFQGGVQYVDLQPGQSTTMDYITSMTTTAGNYKMYVLTENGLVLAGPQDVTVGALPHTVFDVDDLALAGDNKKADKNNLQFSFNLSVSEGYFADQLVLAIFPEDGTTSIFTQTTPYLFVTAGDEQQVHLAANFEEGEAGVTYFADIFHGQINQTGGIYFTINNTDGIEILDGEVSESWYTLDGVRVTKPSVGVYVKKTTSHGKTTVEKVMIKR